MRSLRDRYGNWALVAGAAEGIGAACTLALARQGFNIILVDNNKDAMATLAGKITAQYPVMTQQLHADLAQPDATNRCLIEAGSKGCRLMIYVAAYSKVARFVSLTPVDLDRFINVNSRTLLHLVHGFSSRLIAQQTTGGILIISSLAALIGPQYVSVYAATKAFGITLSEALNAELKPSGIDVTVCISGLVSTPTFLGTNPDFDKIKPLVMHPDETAAFALSNLGKRCRCIPGWQNRAQYFLLQQLMPRSWAGWFVNRYMKKLYRIRE